MPKKTIKKVKKTSPSAKKTKSKKPLKVQVKKATAKKLTPKKPIKKSKNVRSKNSTPAKDIDAFINAAPAVSQNKLRLLREIIKKCAPNTVETISYKMPVFKLNGKGIAGFAAHERHVGFYPMNGSLIKTFKKELADYQTSKGVIQFPIEKPFPITLIKKIIKANLKNLPKTKAKSK